MTNTENTLVLETTKGKVVIEMRPDLAPGHVARIKELVREGFYDGIVFHRVIDGFMAQTGCPQGTGTGGSGKKLKAEFNREKQRRGTVSMARAQNPDSGDSQFFICFDDAAFLNGQYTVWGKVTEGMENVDKIKRGEPVRTPTRSYRPRWRRTLRCELGSANAPTTNRTTLMTIPSGSRTRARLRLAHPGFLGEPFMLGPTDRAVDPRKEDRRGLEAFAVGDDPGRNVLSRRRATDHDGSHLASPCSHCWIERLIAATCEDCLTPWRPYRDEFIERAATYLRDLYRAKCACRPEPAEALRVIVD